ncbi:MAG: TolC family protein [Chlamydiales bacterium]|nr:TolC family protein [Chlamydiales bacterium]
MRNTTLLSSTFGILLLCTGCLPDSAVLSPNSFAPTTSDKYWTPREEPKLRRLFPVTYPEQESPLTLAELVDIALRNNTQTQLTWAQAREAAAKYGQSQSPLFPTATGVFNYEHLRIPIFISPAFNPPGLQTAPTPTNLQEVIYSQWGPALQLSYQVLDFGQTRLTSLAAREALYYADFTHNRAIQNVLQTITLDYYSYLYQKQLLDAYQADVETAKTTLQSADQKLTSGVADVSDVLQATTDLMQKETLFVEQKQEVENAYATLLNDMGLPATFCFNVEGLPKDLPNEPMIKNVDDLLTLALQERYDLKAGESDLKSKEYAVKAATQAFYPTVQFNFNIGRTYFTGGVHDNYDYIAALSLNFPLFSGFQTINNLRQARAKRDESSATLRQKQLSIIKEITTSHYNVKVSHQALTYADKYLKAAAKQYRVSLSKYKAGTANIIDVISAQSFLSDARAKLANGQQQWYTSLATLAYATGIHTQNVVDSIVQPAPAIRASTIEEVGYPKCSEHPNSEELP